MIRPKLLQLVLGCLWLTAVGCGRFEGPSSSSGAEPGAGIPPYLNDLNDISPVPQGSRDVVSLLRPGPISGTALVTLRSEEGAEISYALRPITESSQGLKYEKPLYLVPPVSVWAVARVGDLDGPVRKFEFVFSEQVIGQLSQLEVERLPAIDFDPIPLTNTSTPNLFLVTDDAVASTSVTIDGSLDDWDTLSLRTTATDASQDVPSFLGHIDLQSVRLIEDEQWIILGVATKDRPKSAANVVYGFDLGPSNIDPSSFGDGASFIYRIEVDNGEVFAYDRVDKGKLTLGEETKLAVGQGVELRIARSDLPDLDGLEEIALRPYALDWSMGATVRDRMLPIYFRSNFDLRSTSVDLEGGRSMRLDVFSDPGIGDQPYLKQHLDSSATWVEELERLLGIPLYNLGSIPVFHSLKDSNGFAGLNSSDRGILSTQGPLSSPLAVGQLMAHEIAHFQNAIFSQLDATWIQEGMSEWVAERLLYRHFPAKAVHSYLSELRYDHYVSQVGRQELDEFPLESWDEESSSFAYDKALMFMNVLEKHVGTDTLIGAFRQGVNEPLDSQSFQSYLEMTSGQDLDDVFEFWVYDGTPTDDPRTLFQDPDFDSLMGIDEEKLGTDPEVADTDRDGYSDGEEYFSGRDPLTSSLDANLAPEGSRAVVLVNATSKDTSDFLRLGGESEASFTYSFDPTTTAPEISYLFPGLVRPPYTIRAAATVDGTQGTATTLSRSLYLDGQQISTPYPSNAMMLPSTAFAGQTLSDSSIDMSDDGLGQGTELRAYDFAGDLPQSLSAYDIVEMSFEVASDQTAVEIKTRGSADAYGASGNYVIAFENHSWSESAGASRYRSNALTIANGTPYLHTFVGSSETTTRLQSKASLTFNQSGDGIIRLEIDDDHLEEWNSNGGEQVICIWSEVHLHRQNSSGTIDDFGGCMVRSSTLTRRTGQRTTHFGGSTLTLDLFSQGGSPRMDEHVTVGIKGLNLFSQLLARPLYERDIWPVHIYRNPSGSEFGKATTLTGAFLAAQDSDSENFDYVYLEQLARLYLTSLSDSQVDTPLWIQELFVQWLTASAMYQIHSTREVKNYINPYVLIYRSTSHTQDFPLSEWTSSQSWTVASIKAMMLTFVLDATVGSEAMARALATFPHQLPTADEFKSLLKGYAPSKSSEIDTVWSQWIDGSGSNSADKTAINTLFNDGADDDDIYSFEEAILGDSGQTDDYFN